MKQRSDSDFRKQGLGFWYLCQLEVELDPKAQCFSCHASQKERDDVLMTNEKVKQELMRLLRRTR